MTSPLVDAKWLAEHLQDENVVVVDCRFVLTDADAGREQYEKSHIPGAVYFDLEKDLSGPKQEHGGRHPLPDLDEFVEKLGQAGIDSGRYVVVYDDQNGSFAARLWWMLRYLGHDRVSVLDVSFSQWAEEGYPVSDVIPEPYPTTFEPHIRPEMAVDIDQVKKEKEQENVVLIDSRAAERYRGEKEPMDPKAGHIPGAANYFWKENMAENGKWKSAGELKERFRSVEDKELIVYCGSGVTANANLLALKSIGKDARLYVGSWSDWSSYKENPVATEDK